MKKSVLTAELQIRAIVDEAEKSLNNFGTTLKKAWADGEVPKSLEKSYEHMRTRLKSLQEISKKGIVDTGDLSRAKQDYQAFSKDIHNLSIEFKLMSIEQKKAMLSQEEQESMRQRAEAVKEYTNALEKNRKVLQQRELLKKERENIEAGQDPRRRQLKTSVDDSSSRLERLKKAGGPLVLSKDATEYKNTLKEQAELLDKIGQAQVRVNTLSKRGLKEGGNNQLTEARIELERLLKQQEKFNNMAGKAEYETALSKYNEEIAKLEESISSAKVEVETLDSAFESIDEQLKKLPLKDEQAAFETLKKRLKELGVEGIENAKDLDTLREAIQKLDDDAIAGVDKEIKSMLSSLKKLDGASQQTKREIDSATDSIKAQENALREREAFEGKIKQFLGLAGAAHVLRNALRSAFSTIQELDETMTEMAVVTDLSVGDYWDQLPEYSKRADELGVSINSAYKAATLYYQQGLKTNEVNAISVETLKMAKIANMDAAEATDKMTAALRGFNMELNEASAQRVSDVYSELAAITAADTKEIANAMTKTASIASSAGMEFETTAAFLSQIIETTRESAETAGTAMKTVIARFQELKKAPDEIGEVDGEIVDANAIETALRKVGVSLRDSSGQFRELDDVFLELSSKWDGLDKNTQRYIATIAAGSRQQSRFIAMMQDYGRTQELVAAANNSAGASQRQFEKTTDSLKFKMNQLKTAWEEFTQGIMNSDLLKTGVDILTNFLKIINKSQKTFDGLLGSITKIAGVLTVFKFGSKVFEKLKAPITSFFASIVKDSIAAGIDSAVAFKDGIEIGKKKVEQKAKVETEGTAQSEENPESGETKKTTGYISRAVGWDKFQAGFKESRSAKKHLSKLSKEKSKKQRQADLLKQQEDFKEKSAKLKGTKKGTDEYNKAKTEQGKSLNELKKAKKAMEEYDEAQQKATEKGVAQWKAYGEGVAQVGSTISNAGVAISLFGGILSQLGLEEAGEMLSNIGQYAVLAGTAISTLGPIVTGLIGKLVAGGMSTAAAWFWVAGAVIGIAAIVAAIVETAETLKKISPKEKLKQAQQAADAAAEAADNLTESYENLKSSIEGVDNLQNELSGLVKGTDEWKEAVKEVNEEVLQLIQEYPELAKYVKNTDGVLSLDTNSEAVQEIMLNYEKTAANAKVAATGAQLQAVDAQQSVNYANLRNSAKLDDRSAEEEAVFWEEVVKYGAIGLAGTAAVLIGALTGGTALPVLAAMFASMGAAYGLDELMGTSEMAGEAAYANTSKDIEASRATTQQIAQALASGDLVENGEGFEVKLEEEEFKKKYRNIDTDKLGDYYNALKDGIGDLKDFGIQLNRAEEQAKAYYESMAIQTNNIIDKSGWSQETKDISDKVLNGQLMERYTDEIYNQLAGEDLLNKNLSEDLVRRRTKAIQHTYGTGATLVEGESGWEIQNEKGEILEGGVTSSRLQSIISTAEAQQKYQEFATKMPDISEEIFNKVGGLLVDEGSLSEEQTRNAITSLLSGEGKKLKIGEYNKLNVTLTDESLIDIYNESELLQEAFSSSTDFLETFNDSLSNTETILSNLNEGEFADFMTGEMAASLKQKLDILPDESRKSIYDQILGFTEGKSEQQKTEIINRINLADWKNIESLTSLKIDLEEEFGIEGVEDFIKSLSDQAHAVSSRTTVIDTYGELWKATEKISQSTQKITDLQWKYNQALEKGGAILKNLTGQILETRKDNVLQRKKAFDESQNNLAKLYAQGGLNYGVDLRKAVTLGEFGIEVDQSKLNEYIAGNKITQQQADTFVNNIKEAYQESQDHLQGMREELEAIEELETQGKDAYYELKDMAKEAILSSLQKQIDLQQEVLDATRDANSKIIDKLQEQIDDERQQREQDKAKKNISNLLSRQAYLSMDTSGANSLALLQNEETIAQAEEQLQDELIDQAIQDLSDSNEEAIAQRERQIEIAQNQLDLYENSTELQRELNTQLNDLITEGNEWQQTELGDLITKHFTEGMDSQQAADWAEQIGGSVQLADTWQDTNWSSYSDFVNETMGDIETLLSTLPEDIVKKSTELKFKDQKASLVSAGFKFDRIQDINNEDILNAFTKYSQSEDQGVITSSQSKLSAAGIEYDSKEDYLSKIKDEDIVNETAQTYDEYLSKKVQSERTNAKQAAINAANELTSLKGFDQTTVYKTNLDTFEKLGGTKEEFDSSIKNNFKPETLNGDFPNSGVVKEHGNSGKWKIVDVKIGDKTIEKVTFPWAKPTDKNSWDTWSEEDQTAISAISGKTPSDGWIAMYKGEPAIYWNGYWRKLSEGHSEGPNADKYNQATRTLREEMRKQLVSFNTGGVADFTGPAWLDGTKSRPEYILNADQTKRFFSLVDVLENYDKDSKTSGKSGDNYFDIEINVEKLENDYDVEKVADKIRRMIYDDASYRNVNAINHIR